MKKITLVLITVMTCLFSSNASAGHGAWPMSPETQVSGTLTLLDSGGSVVDAVAFTQGQSFDFLVEWDPVVHDFSAQSHMITSTPATTIFGIDWSAQILSAYNGDTGIYNGVSGSADTSLGAIVGAGQAGMIIEWTAASLTTQFIQIWDITGMGTADTFFLPLDMDGNGVPGVTLETNSPYPGFSLVMDFTATVPVPAAVWLFVSGLLGLGLLGRRHKPS